MQTFGKLILFGVIGYAGWFGYSSFLKPPSEAFKAYQEFSKALAEQDYDEAAKYAEGEALSYIESQQSRYSTPVLEVYGQKAFLPKVNEIAGDLAWIKHKVISEDQESKTLVALKVDEISCRIPPGVASAMCKRPVVFRQSVTMELLDGEWWVTDFSEYKVD